jgi:hypothetical protein
MWQAVITFQARAQREISQAFRFGLSISRCIPIFTHRSLHAIILLSKIAGIPLQDASGMVSGMRQKFHLYL